MLAPLVSPIPSTFQNLTARAHGLRHRSGETGLEDRTDHPEECRTSVPEILADAATGPPEVTGYLPASGPALSSPGPG